MGRRKKETAGVHRERIAEAAEELFTEKGILAVTMDEIAGKAGYSKATLYVYFKDKDEIIGLLTLKSMEKLYECIDSALKEHAELKDRYDAVCASLVRYQEEFPFCFDTVLKGIRIDFDRPDCLPEEKATFDAGERINQLLVRYLEEGMKEGVFRTDLLLVPTVFSMWAMISGLIRMAADKQDYIAREMKLSKEAFLQYGFDSLYRSILKREEKL